MTDHAVSALQPRQQSGPLRQRQDAEEVAGLHHAAHEGCFIANSVKTEIVVGGV